MPGWLSRLSNNERSRFASKLIGSLGEVASFGQPLDFTVEGDLPAIGFDQRAGRTQSVARGRGHLQQIAPERWQGSLQALAGAAGHRRAAAAGGNGHGHITPTHQRGRDEVAIRHVVDGQHRHV